MDLLNVPAAPDPHRDPPFQHETNRTLWIGWGANGVSLALQIIVGGLFFGYLFLFGSIAMVMRGWKPAWFSVHHVEQRIAGTPYRRTESVKSWLFVVLVSLALAASSTWVHRRIAPESPDLAKTIIDGVKNIIEQRKVVIPTPSPAPTPAEDPDQPPLVTLRLRIVHNRVVVIDGLPSKVELYISNSGPQERFALKEVIAALDPQSFQDREGQAREENKLWSKVMARSVEILELPKDIETTRATLNAAQYGDDPKGMSLLKQGWFLYFMGRIEADGHGLEYCVHTDIAEPTKATFCVEHNLPF